MTFEDFCKELPADDRAALIRAIIVRCRVSYQAAYSWTRGQYRPGFLTRENITATLNKMFGKRFTIEELFPTK